MLGICIIIGASALFGLVLGRFYRAPALAAGSALVAVALFVAGEVSGWSAYVRAMLLLSGLTSLQGCYVVGIWTRSAARCRRSSSADRPDRAAPRSESQPESRGE
jgi:hypothetical protein